MIIDFNHKFKLEEENFDNYKCCQCGNILVSRHNNYGADEENFYREIEYLECCNIILTINNYDDENNTNTIFYYIESVCTDNHVIVWDDETNCILYSVLAHVENPIDYPWINLYEGSKFELNKELLEKLERLNILL